MSRKKYDLAGKKSPIHVRTITSSFDKEVKVTVTADSNGGCIRMLLAERINDLWLLVALAHRLGLNKEVRDGIIKELRAIEVGYGNTTPIEFVE